MKKHIFYTVPFLVLSLLFSSCEESLDEVKDEVQGAIDAGELTDPNIVEAKNLVYTLIGEDYTDELKMDNEYFDSSDDAKALLPAFLDNKYPSLSDNGESLATITYNINVGDAFANYSITANEYTGLRSTGYVEGDDILEGFENSLDTEVIQDYIAGVLSTNTTDAQEGDAIIVSYNTFEEIEKASSESAYYETDLTNETEFNAFEAVSVAGDQTWSYDATYGAKISGYASGTDNENEDWLISPEINLTGADNAAITINQALNFLDGSNTNKVLISKDYTTGNYDTATWEEIVFTTVPLGNSWSFVQSELVDISSYKDETVHLALVYDYLDGDTPTWEVDVISIQSSNATTTEIEYESQTALFVYSGSEWEVQETIALTTEDYDAMGEDFGTPGRYDNFDSSINPDDYLPTYLNINTPYASEGDVAYIAYAYYEGGGVTSTRISLYNYSVGNWLAYNSVQEETFQFGLEDGTWVPDNTIAYTLVEPTDYDIIVASELANDADYTDGITSMSNYSNFEISLWPTENIQAALIILLNEIAADAELGQKYSLTVATWNPGDGTATFKFVKDPETGEWVSND